MDQVNVATNWDLEDKGSLKKIITCCSTEKKEFDIETVSTKSCICLNRPNSAILDVAPELEIESVNLIEQIDLLSEGNLIEVFGNNNEYLCSCASDFIDDWDGMAVYHAKIFLPKINKCKLKFKRMKDKNRLWIYNAQLSTLNPQEQSSKEIFNFENVNKLINNSNHHISEKAEKFKSFLEEYVKNSSQLKNLSTQSTDIKTVFNIINRDPNLKFEDSSKSLVVSVNGSEKSFYNASNGNFNIITGKNEGDNTIGIENLKTYIDEKLKEVKDEILRSIEVKLNKFQEESNAKLDTIIKLLESSKT